MSLLIFVSIFIKFVKFCLIFVSNFINDVKFFNIILPNFVKFWFQILSKLSKKVHAFSADEGIPDMPSIDFSYHNVRNELTFHWFKHNIMCKSHSWICEQDKNDEPSEKNKEQKNKNKTGGGSKKSRRKQNAGNSSQVSMGLSVRERSIIYDYY